MTPEELRQAKEDWLGCSEAHGYNDQNRLLGRLIASLYSCTAEICERLDKLVPHPQGDE